MPPSSLLAAERRKATFPVEELTRLLDGGLEGTQKRRWIQRLVEADPVFDNKDNYFLGRTERYQRALRKSKRVDELIVQHGLSEEDGMALRSATADDNPTMLHDLMFLPALKSIFDDEQQARWLPRAQTKQMLGCYAQTEVGHGSNIRALQTTATYIPETDEFEIHTPSLEAAKWWPGTLGRTANHALVVARLLLPSKDYGIHSFLVPIRDLETHRPLPGVTAGDIGPKISFNGMDNGFLMFNHVRIPRANMAMRFVRVERGGEYRRVPGAFERSAYITMMQVRAVLVIHSARELAKACTIAVRYSAVRLQGFDESGVKENQILDYTIQQYRLLSMVAASYAFHFSGLAMRTLIIDTEDALVNGRKEVESLMSSAHTSLAGLKSLCTMIAADGIEDCRKACGGHGYLMASGLPELSCLFLQQCTVEGDNYLLTQQVVGTLLKSYLNVMMKGGSYQLPPDLAYLVEARDIDTEGLVDAATSGSWPEASQALLRLFAARSSGRVARLAERIRVLTEDEGKTRMQAWNLVLVDVVAVSRAHTLHLILGHFIGGVKSVAPGPVQEVLGDLCLLFGLFYLDKDTADFMEEGLLSPSEVQKCREAVVSSLQKVRPNAVALVDAWDWPDFALKSALGKYDGNVYEALYEVARREPLNQSDPVVGWKENIYPLTHSRL